MRRHSRWLAAGQMLLDAALINIAIAIAWYIRYELEWTVPLGEGFYFAPYSAYIPIAAVLTILAIGIFRIEGLYFRKRGRGYVDDLYTLVNGTTTATLLLMAFTFFVRPAVYSRAVYVYAALLIVFLLALERWIGKLIRPSLRKRGIGVDRVLIVGAGEVGRAMMRNIVAMPDLAYHIAGFVDDDEERGHTDIGRFKALGGTEKLARLLADLDVDEVIITLPWTARAKIISIMDLCQHSGTMARVVPDLFQLSLSMVTVDDVGGIPVIGTRTAAIGTWNAVIKRLFDLAGSLVLIVLFSPVMATASILIKLDSPGPIIFRQRRIGRSGKSFITLKFRTMREGAEEEQGRLNGLNEADGPLFKIKNDPRHTRLGRWLRRMSIDELPQLFNVLKGEMSLVGPRPPMQCEVDCYEEWHKQRLEVSPGITGLWQVSGRSELAFDEMCMLDIYYIENWSPWLDFWILLRTVPTVLLARGAY